MSLFADDMILHTENPKYATKKLLELINEFSKVKNTKLICRKSVEFLYTKNKLSERRIKKTISFAIASKRIKYLGLKTCSQKTVRLIKEIEDCTNK